MTTNEKRFERFKTIITSLKSNGIAQKDIAIAMGRQPSYLNTVLKGGRDLTIEVIDDFLAAYPNINKTFIFEGNGAMYMDDIDYTPDSTISEPSMPLYESKLEQSNIQHQNSPLMVYNLDEKTATGLTPASGTISFPGSQNCDFAIYVHGEAMRGAVCNGGAVAVKKINNHNIIPYGHMYYIELSDYELVRYILKSPKEDHVILHAHNDDEYQDFEIPRSEIKALYKVRKTQNNES